jgi:alkylhydroperoxidase/carboxymuconolactone decarboxylase family protein YurZ
MAQRSSAGRSGAGRVTGAIADATGRTEDELRVALTVAIFAAGFIAALRLLKFFGDLGSHAFGHSRR